MKKDIALAALTFGLLPIAGAAPTSSSPIKEQAAAHVNVTILSGTIIGNAIDNVESFNGIPFADPPTGPLRLKPPKKLFRELGTYDATGIAVMCPQGPIFSTSSSDTSQDLTAFNSILGGSLGVRVTSSEDCLSVTVQRPRGTRDGDNLPVLFYIFGGGFLFGSTAANDATKLIETGIELNQPFIFVGVNYRVGGWGFMPGAEILRDGSANVGLLDQRMGLEWVADNIAAFGGDPSKVTIWGGSSGSISVFDQMLMYDGDAIYQDKPLFRAAIMNSGSVTPTDPVDCPKAQAVYDKVVKEAGCEGQSDTLGCLRRLPEDRFAEAANSIPGVISYESLALSYLPRPDGKVLTESPDVLVKDGKFYAVPMIYGTQEDEGTLFSSKQKDMGTTDKIVNYLEQYYFKDANKSLITTFVNTYSTKVTDGSPYRSNLLLEAYPGKRRIASILGDIVFTLIRRWTLEAVATVRPRLPLWSCFASYNYFYGYSPTGTQHGSDKTALFDLDNSNHATITGRKYYINFLYNLDPNVGVETETFWPKWTEDHQLLWFNFSNNGLLDDTFRNSSYQFMKANIDYLHF